MAGQYISHYASPLGGITLGSDGESLAGLWFDGQKYFGASLAEGAEEKDLPVFGQARCWLDIYFGGGIPDFTPPLALRGTKFRQSVWEILLQIPYGETMSYGEIAGRVAESGFAKMSARAVGGAIAHNPISIIIPCHRAIGSDGNLTGYAGGLSRKAALLTLEKTDAGRG